MDPLWCNLLHWCTCESIDVLFCTEEFPNKLDVTSMMIFAVVVSHYRVMLVKLVSARDNCIGYCTNQVLLAV